MPQDSKKTMAQEPILQPSIVVEKYLQLAIVRFLRYTFELDDESKDLCTIATPIGIDAELYIDDIGAWIITWRFYALCILNCKKMVLLLTHSSVNQQSKRLIG